MGILLSQASSTKADCDPLVAQVLRVSFIMKDGEEDQEPQKAPSSYSLAGDRICGNLQELHRGKDTENPSKKMCPLGGCDAAQCAHCCRKGNCNSLVRPRSLARFLDIK